MAFDFNGTTDYVTQTAVPQVGAGSIGGWINCDAYPSGTDKMVIGSFYQETESENYTTYDKTAYLNNSGLLKFYIYDGGAKAVTSLAIGTGSWAHFLATFNGTTLILYINGASVASTSAGNSYSGYGNPSWRFGAKTGALDGEATRVRFDGKMAEFGIWTRALTADEAAGLAKGFSPSCYPINLVSYMPLIRDLIDQKLAAPTASGTAVADHPNIIYPRGVSAHIVSAAAAAGQPTIRRYSAMTLKQYEIGRESALIY